MSIREGSADQARFGGRFANERCELPSKGKNGDLTEAVVEKPE